LLEEENDVRELKGKGPKANKREEWASVVHEAKLLKEDHAAEE
jgi:hypothetical protein